MTTETASSNRSLIIKTYVWMTLFLLFLLGWMISGSCYFNRTIYQAMNWSLPAMAIAWSIAYGRSLHRSGYVVRAKQNVRKLNPAAASFQIAAMGGLLGTTTWFCLYALGCLVLFASSREEARSVAALRIEYHGGHCGISYSFFDPLLDRQVNGCGLPYRNARSGDNAIVMRTAGPLGIHLQSVSPAIDSDTSRPPR